MGDPTGNPALELAPSTQTLAVHAQPALHLDAAHLERLSVWPGAKSSSVARVDPHHQPTAAAHRYRHMAID